MDTCLDLSLASSYTSHSQMARVVTEDWVERNMYCPRCGCSHLEHLKANQPVADFACPQCGEIFESKAKRGQDFLMVPKHFFIDSIIEKRKPLAPTARRAGWMGCSILLEEVPSWGRIEIIRGGLVADKEEVCRQYRSTSFLGDMNLSSRGWLMDVFRCMEEIKGETFTLQDMYGFEERLALLHPDNHNIRAKIRQQLQMLRDRGLIRFMERGVYRKC